MYDEAHSESEERWATIGQAENGQYLVIIHTFGHTSPIDVAIRVISARKATKHEVRDYEQSKRPANTVFPNWKGLGTMRG